jgi:hypothetical protein
MSLRAAPELIANLRSHDVTTRRYIRSIFEISKLNTLYNDVFITVRIVD